MQRSSCGLKWFTRWI